MRLWLLRLNSPCDNRREAKKDLAEFYPEDADGATPIAYLWARTIQCEGPGCGAEVPLIRNLQLTRKGRKWSLRLRPVPKRLEIDLVEGVTNVEGTVRNGSASCPCCNYATPAKSVKAQLCASRGGAESPRLLAVYVQRACAREFRPPTESDQAAFAAASLKLDRTRLPEDEINNELKSPEFFTREMSLALNLRTEGARPQRNCRCRVRG